jgi:hypothetical protein
MAKQIDVEVGQVWTARVSGKLTKVRVDSVKVAGAGRVYSSKKKTSYGLTNINTGRILGARTAAFLRVRVS